MDLFEELKAGLEDAGLTEIAASDTDFQDRLQTLQDRMQAIEETGLVCRDQVQQLVTSGVELNERRYPIASFTTEPSPVGVRPALEAADGEKNSIIKKMIEAAVAAFKRVVDWIKTAYRKVVELIKSVRGKKTIEAASAAPKVFPQLNSLHDDLPGIMSKLRAEAPKKSSSKGVNEKDVLSAIDEAWEDFLRKDQAFAVQLNKNVLFSSDMFSTPKGRQDILAVIHAFPLLQKQMAEGIKLVTGELGAELTQHNQFRGDVPDEVLDRLVEKAESLIEKYNHHPMTTLLYKTYGDGGSKEDPTILEGLQALTSHMSASGRSDKERRDWRTLTPELTKVLTDLVPSKFAEFLVTSRNPEQYMNVSQTSLAAMMLDFRRSNGSPKVVATLRHVLQLQSEMNRLMLETYHIEISTVGAFMEVGNVVRRRIESYLMMTNRLAEQYRKIGLEDDFNKLIDAYSRELTAYGWGSED